MARLISGSCSTKSKGDKFIGCEAEVLTGIWAAI